MLYPAFGGDERATKDTAMLYTKPSPRMLLPTIGMNPVAFLTEGRIHGRLPQSIEIK
jgi:hypothetical protein